MKISSNNLIGLDVVTQSGQQLGRVTSFNIETDSQSILEYVVKPANIVKDLITKDLIIPRGQVIEITNDKIVVEDSLSGSKNNEKEKKSAKQEAVSGAAFKQK